MSETTRRWLSFQLHDQGFGIEADRVKKMILAKNIRETTATGRYLRGVVNLDGTTIPVLDVRQRIGMKSRKNELDELIRTLGLYERDHVSWLSELRASIEENRDFSRTSDPSICGFGRWLKQFEPETERIRAHLSLFAEPHRLLHETAFKVQQHLDSGAIQDALDAVDSAWQSEYAELTDLFKTLKSLLREESSEIVLVAGYHRGFVGLVVESVMEIWGIADREIVPPDKMPDGTQIDWVKGLAPVAKDVKILISLDALIRGTGADGWGETEGTPNISPRSYLRTA